MDTFLKDVRYGCRTLLRNPGFTAVAVLSLALGIGANTAVFSFIDTILLRTLPVQNPKELVLLGAGKRRGNSSRSFAVNSGVGRCFSFSEIRISPSIGPTVAESESAMLMPL